MTRILRCFVPMAAWLLACADAGAAGNLTPPAGGFAPDIHVTAGANLSAVSRAAPVGSTIYVHAGTYYNCSNLLKPGVNWYGLPGATLTFTNTTNNGPGWGIFDDRFTGATTSTISGFNFIWSSGQPGTNAFGAPCCYPTNVAGAIVITNATSRLNVDFEEVRYSSLGASHSPFWIVNTPLSQIRGRNIEDIFYSTNFLVGLDDIGSPVYEDSQGVGFYWEAGETHFTCNRVRGRLYSIWGQARTDSHSNLWAQVDKPAGSIYVDGTGAPSDWKTWFTRLGEVDTQTNNAGSGTIVVLGGGRHYFIVEKLHNTMGFPTVNIGAGEVWLTAQKLSGKSQFIKVTGGLLHAGVDDFESLGITDLGMQVTGAGKIDFLRGGKNTNVAALVSGRYTNDSIFPDSIVGIPNTLSALGRTNLLPSAAAFPNRTITVYDSGKTAAGTNVWVQAVGVETIARGPTLTNITANGGSLTVQSDGANWLIVGSWP
jgi:hypothetical protein